MIFNGVGLQLNKYLYIDSTIASVSKNRVGLIIIIDYVFVAPTVSQIVKVLLNKDICENLHVCGKMSALVVVVDTPMPVFSVSLLFHNICIYVS